MGEERFCNRCGTDNGAVKTDTSEMTPKTNAPAKLDVSLILNYAASIFFVIAELMLLTVCCRCAKYASVYSMLHTGTSLFAVIFFAIGMWGCIPALKFVLNIKKDNTSRVVGNAVVMVAVMIIVCLVNVIFAKASGVMKCLSAMTVFYKAKAAKVIIFALLAAVAGIAAPRMKN